MTVNFSVQQDGGTRRMYVEKGEHTVCLGPDYAIGGGSADNKVVIPALIVSELRNCTVPLNSA